jgi:hypothetical protein
VAIFPVNLMTYFPNQELILPLGFILVLEKQNDQGYYKNPGGVFIPSCNAAVNESTEEAMHQLKWFILQQEHWKTNSGYFRQPPDVFRKFTGLQTTA